MSEPIVICIMQEICGKCVLEEICALRFNLANFVKILVDYFFVIVVAFMHLLFVFNLWHFLTYFSPMFLFRRLCFFTFSVRIEMEPWVKMGLKDQMVHEN